MTSQGLPAAFVRLCHSLRLLLKDSEAGGGQALRSGGQEAPGRALSEQASAPRVPAVFG